MKHLLFLAVLMAASLSVACDSLPQFQSPTAPAPARLADFTVVAKRTEYKPPSSRPGFYMTMVFAGVERESSVSIACYENTQIGRVAGPDCR